MAFWEDLTADAVLPAAIRTALSISDSEAVYVGRRPEKIPRGLSVWIERMPAEQSGGSGFQHITNFVINVHVFHRALQRGSQSGEDQLTAVQAHLRSLVSLFNGVQPLTTLSSLFTTKAVEEEVDADEDQQEIEGVVEVTFYVSGDGQ